MILEADGAVDEGEECVILGETYVATGLPLGAVLPEDDGSPPHLLSPKALHAQSLGVAVPAVAARSLTFLVGHLLSSVLGVDRVDPQCGEGLTMPPRSPVVLPFLVLEDTDLAVPALVEDGPDHGRALQVRCAHAHPPLVPDEKDVAQRDLVTNRCVEALQVHSCALLDPVLLAAGSYDCVHRSCLLRRPVETN